VAKIKKQKKSGMLRRQKQKRHNKMLNRRKVMPKRKPQFQNSAQIEKLLNVLPTLAFEPELLDLRMDKARLKELIKNDLSETEILLALISEEFIYELNRRLVSLENANSEKSIKHALSKATRHQLAENSKISQVSNPVIVAIFLKTRLSLEGRELDLEGLPEAMEEFEQKNNENIKLLTDQIQNGEKEDFVSVESEEIDLKEEVEKKKSPLGEKVYKKFLDLVPLEKLERTEEDLEVFLVDYQPPNINEWDFGMIKHFIGEWFLENANPLKEDLDSMRESLLILFQFLDREELLPNGVLDQVSEFLENNKS
tara:strand:+ start:601 stop:1533 length:933 start_codon:yes stop_codon:yes gene_type:complete